ncbi:MAG: chemotaxis protein [Pseudomonadota bacterium]|nr:chemotaxis protein [Pseudomonadota bacterium]
MAALMVEAGLATEELEIELLLEALFQRFGYDFRSYDRPTLRRKLHQVMQGRGLTTVSSLQDRVLHDPGVGAALLRALSVQPAALFDDPEQARQMRIVLASCLRASAVPKVWLAECAGPEEAWSLAILLAEEQLHLRTEIYATVANEEMLAAASLASFPAERMEQYQESYFKSGGTAQLTDYFDVKDGRAVLVSSLQNRITWAQYNMVTDASFNEFQMIICQRALPDFGPLLRQRVLRLFHDSLSLFGVLGLDREIADGDPLAAGYQPVFPHQPWYKRIA